MKRYLALNDVVQRYAGVYSAWTLREKARAGEIPHRKHANGARLLFLEAELDAWDDGAPLDVKQLRGGGRVVTPRVERQKRAA